MKRLFLAATIAAAIALPSAAFAQKSKKAEKSQDEYQDEYTEARMYFKNGKINFQSKNGDFKTSLNNCIYADAAMYLPHQSISGLEYSNPSLSGDDGIFRFSNGFLARRVRLGAKAQIRDKWFAELDVEFAYNGVDIKDMFIKHQFNKMFSMRVGNFKESLSLEQQSGSLYLATLERPMAIQTFTGGRRLGIAATGFGDKWWASAGLFGGRFNSKQREENRGNDGIGVSGRVAYIPIKTDDAVLHIGVGGLWRKPDAWGGKDRVVTFGADTESRVDAHSFVQWSSKGYSDNYATFSTEMAFRYKKLLVVGEYVGTSVGRYDYATAADNTQSRVDVGRAYLSGWYASASYMILGAQRSYVSAEGEFGAMKVRKKSGNLEVVARVSGINFNDDAVVGYECMGGKATNYTAAVNWFPNSNLVVGLNYIFVNNDKNADAGGDIIYDGGLLADSVEWQNGIDFCIVQLRVAVSF